MFKVSVINRNLFLEIDQGESLKLEVVSADCEFVSMGCYGLVKRDSCVFLIFVIQVRNRGLMFNKKVFEISKFTVIQVDGEPDTATIKNISDFAELPGLYFSDYELHINRSFDKSDNTDFFWNFVPFTNLLKKDKRFEHFLVKCIQGFFDTKLVNDYKLVLISRRCWRRAGVRYFSRGLNNEGYPANFVETEQFLIYGDSEVASYLQIRGSIPLHWKHEIDLAWTPKILIENSNFFKKAKRILQKKYYRVFYLNLLRNLGYEKEICEVYKKLICNENHLNYDFYNKFIKCANSTDNEFIQIADKILLETFDTKTNTQKCVVRVNCIDCLDRTNICQFLISSRFLKKICKKSNDFNKTLKFNQQLWYENGNFLSKQYAGTNAIFSDIIYGTSTLSDTFNDIINSIKRYFINRVRHRILQNTYNILTGQNSIEFINRNCFLYFFKMFICCNYLNLFLILISILSK